jgi:hypothetical protein
MEFYRDLRLSTSDHAFLSPVDQFMESQTTNIHIVMNAKTAIELILTFTVTLIK